MKPAMTFLRLALFATTTSGCLSAAMAQMHNHEGMSHGNHDAHAHHSNYVGMTNRDIKALSAEQTEELLNGRGMGLSLPAELNRTPGPKHLLEMRDRLGLSDEQSQKLKGIVDSMQKDAEALGKSIVDAERELDRSFKQGKATTASVDKQTGEIGRLMGQLRAVHLKAHLLATALLTPKQIDAYDRERGYATDAHSASSQ